MAAKRWKEYEEATRAAHITAVAEGVAAHCRKVSDTLGKPEPELSTFDLEPIPK